MAVKISEEALLNDASESLAELTGLDQEWLSAVLRHRKQQFRKLLREDVGSKTVEQGSGEITFHHRPIVAIFLVVIKRNIDFQHCMSVKLSETGMTLRSCV